MRRGLKGTPGHQRDVVTGAAGDAGDTCGLERFREGHCWQDGQTATPRMERLIKESEEPGGECLMPSLVLYQYRPNLTFQLVT